MEEARDELPVFPTDEGQGHPIFIGPTAALFTPPPPTPPPSPRRFGLGQALLTIGGAALLMILALDRRDLRDFTTTIKKDIHDLSTTTKKTVDVSEKLLDITEQLVTKGVEFKYNILTGNGQVMVRGGYEKKKVYKFWRSMGELLVDRTNMGTTGHVISGDSSLVEMCIPSATYCG